MKANELMIGDWVSLFQGNCDFSPCNCKVNSISEYEIGIDGCDEYDYATLPLLFPIPITPDILEKNGFIEINDDEKWYKMQLLEENDFIGLENFEDYGWVFAAVVFPDLINHLSIKYVHELQHAFKLCNIDKEIVL